MGLVWKAASDIEQFVYDVAEKHHLPRLDNARFAVAFNDAKPFVKNKFNWGKVSKFSNFNQIWQSAKFDFSIVLSSEVWTILSPEQKEALVDLHLGCCMVEYVPQTVNEGKKEIVVKDDLGRVQYTDELKLDDEGNPKWYVSPLDINVFAQNISRYGLWCRDYCEVQDLIQKDQ